MAKAQDDGNKTRADNLTMPDDPWDTTKRSISIFEQCDDLELRICIIPHSSLSENQIAKLTDMKFFQIFFWKTLSVRIKTFVGPQSIAY